MGGCRDDVVQAAEAEEAEVVAPVPGVQPDGPRTASPRPACTEGRERPADKQARSGPAAYCLTGAVQVFPSLVFVSYRFPSTPMLTRTTGGFQSPGGGVVITMLVPFGVRIA
jgi:hypothetical protein